MTDVLTDILATLKLRGHLYFRTDFAAPWSVRMPADSLSVRVHLVVAGECWATVSEHGAGDVDAIALSPGDFILIPHGAAQVLADEPGRPPADLSAVLRETGFTGEGPLRYGPPDAPRRTRLVCGFCGFEPGADHPLLRSLPGHILIRAAESMNYAWLSEAVRGLTYETQAENLGSQAVIDRLVEILFIQGIRAYADDAPEGSGFFDGLADPHIRRALEAIHRQPEAAWTLASLGREAGLSRSRFAERFRQRLGQPPADYLTEWRLQKARIMLKETRLSIEQIAAHVGYRSLPSFSRLFKRRVGIGPGRYRRDAAPERRNTNA